MTTERPPAEVRCNAELGPLPEPVAFLSDDGNRLAFHAHRDYTRPLVTMDQALAMVTAERERCATLCDNWTREGVIDACCDEAMDFARKSLAAAIRA